MNRDTTPASTHLSINKAISESETEENTITTYIIIGPSEDVHGISRYITTIDPIIIDHALIHPSMYKQSQPSVVKVVPHQYESTKLIGVINLSKSQDLIY